MPVGMDHSSHRTEAISAYSTNAPIQTPICAVNRLHACPSQLKSTRPVGGGGAYPPGGPP